MEQAVMLISGLDLWVAIVVCRLVENEKCVRHLQKEHANTYERMMGIVTK